MVSLENTSAGSHRAKEEEGDLKKKTTEEKLR